DVEQLLGEVGVIAHLEGVAQMWLQPVGAPDPVDQGVVGPERLGEGACAPVSRIGGLLLGSHFGDPTDELLALLGGSSTARCVLLDPRDSQRGESVAPAGDSATGEVQLGSDVLVPLALGGGQDDSGARNQSGLGAPPSGPSFESRPVRVAQGDLAG